MEGINNMAKQILDQVNEDLENIQRLSPESEEYVDNIKINITAGLTNIRFLIQDKVRLREITICDERKFHIVNREVAVMVLGVVKRANTSNPSAHFSVAWGAGHPLNVAKPNLLSTRTRNNTSLLGLLAALTQTAQLGFKKIKVMSNNLYLKKIIMQIELYHADNYMDEDRQPLPDQDILKMVHEKINHNNIILSAFTFQPLSPLSELYRLLLETARTNFSIWEICQCS